MLIFRSRQNGFTLIEVIVAVSIFSILSVGCYRIVNGIISAQDRIASHSERMHEVSRAIRIMESDFQQMIDRKILDDNGNSLSAYLTDIKNYKSEKMLVEFTRIGYRNPLLLKKSEIVRVSYGYQDEIDQEELEAFGLSDKNNKKTGYLIRYVWPVLDRGNTTEPEKQVLLTGISSLDFEYFDEDGDWVSDWPPLSGGKKYDIPYAIKFKISIDDKFFIERVFSMRMIQK